MPTVSEIFYGRRAYRIAENDRGDLNAVTLAADELQAAQGRLRTAISSAHAADLPLRAIAAAANISHEQVRRILKRAVT